MQTIQPIRVVSIILGTNRFWRASECASIGQNGSPRPHAIIAMVTAIRIAPGLLLVLLGLYALTGVFQGASLFVGARALSNVNFWSSVALVAYLSSVALLVRPWRMVGSIPKPFHVVGVVVFLIAGSWVALPLATDAMAADACLDSGGSYDYVASTCDRVENHPYIGFFWRSGFRLTLSVVFTLIAASLAFHAAGSSRDIALTIARRVRANPRR